MTKNICAAGYDMGNGERCRVCGATEDTSCGRSHEILAKLERQNADLLVACKKAAATLNEMVLTARVVGLEGTSDWDKLVGHSDLIRTRAALRSAIAAAEPKP